MMNSKEAFIGKVTGTIRAEQKARVLESGGRVLKFTNNGGKLYFRYFFPHPETLTWSKLVNGLRVLFSIPSTDLYIRYTDFDETKIMVNDDSGLRIMFDETRGSDIIRIEVISEGALSNTNSMHMDDVPPSLADSGPKMTMPMPMPPSGFPGMDASRPPSAISNHTAATGQVRPQQPMMMSGGMPQAYNRNDNASTSTMAPPKPQQPLQ
ncbi:hypothetical protein IW140_002972 [Coemansia sp. RSA 1813]|nr:hypothetical protein EV178_003824 [Coemansia sp. RSA 1646]KAJ1770600.1 hypothetical protein LPJ74_003049 [Coemansia sp. RSA 1843]KAJ2091402.1 hypothetical protein IW138_001861 [Coemansia sp. RSA 986]KAJ2212841.1 hypothetical protein EV179_004328 [Coemansia sp. RSA 487]KAJ2569564.1 hypothetical protein IW140_002972 [Coemansia sp. RSA 1813]